MQQKDSTRCPEQKVWQRGLGVFNFKKKLET